MFLPIYAVIDTNVIVSAMLNIQSPPGQIVQMSLEGDIIPLMDDRIFSEYRDVLLRPKFGFSRALVDTFLDGLREHSLYVISEPLRLEFSDKDDIVFYEIVISHNKQAPSFLITGNIRHFPPAPFIVTPRQMLDIIKSTEH